MITRAVSKDTEHQQALPNLLFCRHLLCLKSLCQEYDTSSLSKALKRYTLTADVWNNAAAPPIVVENPVWAGFDQEDIALNNGAAYVWKGSVEGRSWNG